MRLEKGRKLGSGNRATDRDSTYSQKTRLGCTVYTCSMLVTLVGSNIDHELGI